MKKLIGIPIGILFILLAILPWKSTDAATNNPIRLTQIWSGDRHGTASKFQTSDGTGTNGNLPKFNVAGSLVDSGVSVTSAGGAVPLTSGTSVTLTGNYRVFRCLAACFVTVPVPSAGVQYVVYNAPGVSSKITLLGIGSSARYGLMDQTGYGTPGTGTMVSDGAIGDKIILQGVDSTHYDMPSHGGNWIGN
jgi:hypothetical protein